MHTTTKSLLTALATALILASAVSTATAGRLSTSSQTFRQVWTPLTFSTQAEGQGVTIRCNVTLEGSFHYRSIVKQARSLIGYITKAAFSHPGCAGGEFWMLNGVEVVLGTTTPNTLPWHLTYEAFEGTLPNIAGVRLLLRPQWISNAIGVLCLYEGNIQAVAKLTRGRITQLQPDGTIGTTKKSGGIFCGATGFFSLEAGAGSTFTVLGSATEVTLTLI